MQPFDQKEEKKSTLPPWYSENLGRATQHPLRPIRSPTRPTYSIRPDIEYSSFQRPQNFYATFTPTRPSGSIETNMMRRPTPRPSILPTEFTISDIIKSSSSLTRKISPNSNYNFVIACSQCFFENMFMPYTPPFIHNELFNNLPNKNSSIFSDLSSVYEKDKNNWTALPEKYWKNNNIDELLKENPEILTVFSSLCDCL